jgi:hypothetical protein
MLLIIPKLPIISKTPRKRSKHLNTIFPNSFQNFRHETQIVNTTGRIEKLVGEVLLVGLAENGKAKFGEDDGGAEGVVEVV